MESVELLLEKLARYPSSDTVANPYREQYAVDNLRYYFEFMFRQSGKRIMLVGEAPGHRGCRITGIPFTSGRVFRDVSHPLLLKLKEKISLPLVETESTATIVWNYLLGKEVTPLFWNSFPFHPFHAGKAAGNRAPSDSEVEFGSKMLRELHDIYRPDFVAGIGHKGVAALSHIFPSQDILYIRHPSNGGKPQFIEGMDNVI